MKKVGCPWCRDLAVNITRHKDQNLCVFYIYSNNVEDKLQHAPVMKAKINMHNT